MAESIIKEGAFIAVMTKIDRTLTKIYNLETNNSEYSSVRETTSTHTRSPSNPTETITKTGIGKITKIRTKTL